MSNNTSLKVKVQTWNKQNYELFDTESKEYKTSNFVFLMDGFIYRNNTDNETYQIDGLEQLKQYQNDPSNFKILMVVQRVNGQQCSYYFGSPKNMNVQDSNSDDLWLQIKTKNMEEALLYSWQIKEKDIIKIGKKVYRVLKICSSNQKSTFFLQKPHYESFGSLIGSHYDSTIINSPTQTMTESTKKLCRICLSGTFDQNNPLLSACNCSGSTKYIHYDCLKTWLDGKIQIRKFPPYFIEVNSKSVKCEICLQYYPPSVYLQNKQNSCYQLYELGDLSLQNYVILEDLEGTILILNFFEVEELTLGRGHESQIRISEITVSRSHVKFYLNNSRLYVQDLQSKFGTQVKLQSPKQIVEDEIMELQSGRSKLSLRLSVKPSNFINLCSCSFF